MKIKDKNYLSTGLIVFLFLLLLFQSRFIWMDFGQKEENFNGNANSTQIMTEVLMPQRIVANYSFKEHYVLLETRKFWSEFIKDISETLKKATSDNLMVISTDEFLNLQNKESIVFKFNSPLSGSIFVNLIGDEGGASDINLSVDSIYIDKENQIYVAGGNNYYKLDGIKTNINIEDVLEEGKKNGIESLNFFEAYGIKKDILVPKNNHIKIEKVYYKSGLKDLLDSEKSNLAQRFLNAPIDYIREITEDDKETFVYENEYLSLTNTSIEYSNNSKFTNEDRNLYRSLNKAIEFIARKTSISGGIYLEKIEPLDLGENRGYSFYFNLKDGAIPLVLTSKDHSFIEIDVFSEHVKSYREYYIRKVDDPSYEQEDIYLEDIDDIARRNTHLFDGDKVVDMLSKITSINMVYLNDQESAVKKPKLVYEIICGDKKYYFDVTDGKLEMFKNGLEKVENNSNNSAFNS